MNKKYLKILGIIIALIISAGMLSGRVLFEIIITGLFSLPFTVGDAFDNSLSSIASMVYGIFLILLFICAYKFLKRNKFPFVLSSIIVLIVFLLGLIGLTGWTFFIKYLNPVHWGF